MPYAKEVTGSWAGVPIPSWLRAFDVRRDDSESQPRAPGGETLWSDECAAVDLGLKAGFFGHASYPLSCSGCDDTRTCGDEVIATLVREMILAAEIVRAEYEQALARPSKNGGSHDKPVAIALANYGWSVIADSCECAVTRK